MSHCADIQHLWLPEDGCGPQLKHVVAVKPILRVSGNIVVCSDVIFCEAKNTALCWNAWNWLSSDVSSLPRRTDISQFRNLVVIGSSWESFEAARMQGAAGAYRGGVWGFQTPPPEIPKFWQSRTWLQIERKMFSVPIPTY
jgi:hypothetical protein